MEQSEVGEGHKWLLHWRIPLNSFVRTKHLFGDPVVLLPTNEKLLTQAVTKYDAFGKNSFSLVFILRRRRLFILNCTKIKNLFAKAMGKRKHIQFRPHRGIDVTN